MIHKKLSQIKNSSSEEIVFNIRELISYDEYLAWQVIQSKPFSSYTEDQLLTIYECFSPDLSFEEWLEINGVS